MKYRVALWALLVVGAAALAVGVASPFAPGSDGARTRAVGFHAEALRLLEAGDPLGAAAALASAIQSDSSYLPALLDVHAPNQVFGFGRSYPVLDSLLRQMAVRPGQPLARCALAWTETERQRAVPPDPRLPEGHVCNRLVRLVVEDFRLTPEERAAAWENLALEVPAAVVPWFRALGERLGTRDWGRIAAFAARTARSHHSLVRARAKAYLAVALHGMGRHGEALAEDVRGRQQAGVAPGLEAFWIRAWGDHNVLEADSLEPGLARHLDSVRRVVAEASADRATSGDPWERLNLAQGRMGRLLDEGDLGASLALGDSMVALADSLGDGRGLADTHLLLGRAAVKAGAAELAERHLLATQEYAIEADFLEREYEAAHNLLHLYEGLGRDTEARRAGERFVELTERAVLAPVRMMSHRDMGVFLRRHGEWEPAQRHFDRMVDLIDTLGVSVPDYAFYAGEYFESIGAIDRAAAYYGRVKHGPERSRVLEALVRIAEASSDTAAALASAATFDRLRVKGFPEHRPLLPGVLARLGRHTEAVHGLEEARRGAEQRGQMASWSRLTLELAEVGYSRGDPTRAAVLADSAARVAERVAEREVALRADALAAAAAVRDGQAPAVVHRSRLDHFRRQARRMRLPVLDFDLALLAGEAALTVGAAEAGFAALRTAQHLADSLATGAAYDPAQAGLRAARLTPSDRALSFAIPRRNESAALEWWVEWSWRRKARGNRSAPPALASLRRLAAETPIVDYVVLDSVVAALVVTGRRAAIEVLPMTPAEARSALAALYSGVSAGVGGMLDRRRARLDPDILQRLSAGLFDPLIKHLDGEQQLVVVPDGILHLVPFDVLPIADAGSTVPALERFAVIRLPALGARSGAGRPLPDGPVVIVQGGDSTQVVPGAQREVDSVRTVISRRAVTVLSGQEATEERLRAVVSGAAVLHLAAHAKPNVLNPDLAGVRLAADAAHDGRLQAHEIRRLPLRGSLVILSACETGAGRILRGEGPLSLSRAFLQAGAKEVVATLWPVGESAADLMTEFHRALDRGLAPAEALRQAKRAARAQGADPLAWVPFTLFASSQ